MPGNILYLHLLICCGIWTQEIIGTSADEEIKESSDVLIREKRVTSRIPGEDRTVQITNLPYVVNIKHKGRINCVGSILSRYVVVTLASCVDLHAVSEFEVASGSSRSPSGVRRPVINIKRHYANPNRPSDGIALLTVDPPFVFGPSTNKIELHSAPLMPDTPGIVSGWGYDCGTADRGTNIPLELRSIEVPIMAHRDCVNLYRPHLEISEMDICTYHEERKCGHNDGGAPLVVDGHLVGIYLRTGIFIRGLHYQNYPDVFIMLQHSAYNQWITANVRNIDLQMNSRHH